MRHLRSLCVVSLALAGFCITAAARAETPLPSLLFLPGTTEGEFEAKCATCKISIPGLQKITATGYRFRLTGQDMFELGAAELEIDGVALLTKRCNTAGDATGTVLVSGAEWHLALGLATEPFLLLILIPSGGIRYECEGVTVTLTGNEAWQGSPFGSETTSLSASTGACSGSTPKFSEYDTMSGGMAKVELLSEFGGIKAKECVEIEGNITFTASHDVEIMDA